VFSNHIPGCRTPRRTGCVVAYSTFNATPPEDAIFGRPSGALVDAFGMTGRTDLQVLCTNPASLAGGYAPSRPSSQPCHTPARSGSASRSCSMAAPPAAPTPWVEPQDHYTAACVKSNGADVLMLSPVGGARQLTPCPDTTWGLHLSDVNIALGTSWTSSARKPGPT